MTHDLKGEFWDRIGKVQAGMLQADGHRAIPMSPFADRKENSIWFITASGTEVAMAAENGYDASLQIADSSSHLYGTVNGRISMVNDPEKLDELWNAFAAAWFKDGRDDDSIRLIQMRPARAEVWATESTAAFLYDVAKANLTDSTPDAGDHGVVTF